MIKNADKNYIASKYPQGGVFKTFEAKRRGHIVLWVITILYAAGVIIPVKNGIANLAYYKEIGDSSMITFGVGMLAAIAVILVLLVFGAIALTKKNNRTKKDPLSKYLKANPHYTREQLEDFDRQICSGEGIFIRDDAGTSGSNADIILTKDWIKTSVDGIIHMDDVCAAFYTPQYGGMSASHLVILDKRKKIYSTILGKYEIDAAVSIIKSRNPYIFSDRSIKIGGREVKLPKEAGLVVEEYEIRKRDAGL